MAKMTLEDLRNLRNEKKQEMEMRETANKTIQIIVGMGTSGIAAGAKETLKAFTEELSKFGLTQVRLRQAGSLGLDHAEPVVEVKVPDMPDTIYGKVNAAVARQIIEQHILEKRLVNEHVFDRPSADILSEK
jgi:NADP-reducing hydrogenase subunit HndB